MKKYLMILSAVLVFSFTQPSVTSLIETNIEVSEVPYSLPYEH